LVHLNGCIPRPRIRRSGGLCGRSGATSTSAASPSIRTPSRPCWEACRDGSSDAAEGDRRGRAGEGRPDQPRGRGGRPKGVGSLMPTISLAEDELAAVVAALRRVIEDDSIRTLRGWIR
jgi:hypothetical protein